MLLLRLVALIFCGVCVPFSDKAHAQEDDAWTADKVEECCEKIIRGEMKYEDFAKSLPEIKHLAATSTNRTRIRDSLKKILFNVKLERTAYCNLQEAILDISEA